MEAQDRDQILESMFGSDEYEKLIDRVGKWWFHIKNYQQPNESLSQFSIRAGVGRDEAFNWKTRGRVPRPEKMIIVMENLGVPKEKQKEILLRATGLPKDNGDTQKAEINEGYVYPNHNGVDDAEGRLGFKNVFLETNNIKPEAVKLVICDTQAMEPLIRQRDMLLVDMSKTIPQSGKIYLLELTDEPDQQIVSKVAVIPGRRYNIIFENKEIMNSYAVDQDGVLIHGEVVFVGRLL